MVRLRNGLTPMLWLVLACGSDPGTPAPDAGSPTEEDGSDDGSDGSSGDDGSQDAAAPTEEPDAGEPSGRDAGDDHDASLDGGATEQDDAGTTDAGASTGIARILVYNRVDLHPVTGVERGHTGSGADEALLEELGLEHGFEVVITDEGESFSAANLAGFDVVVFASPHYEGQELSATQRDALEAFVRQGGGWLGWHYALKVETSWPFLKTLAGGITLGGHVGGEQQSQYTLVNTTHPVTRDLARRFSSRDDYIKINGALAPNVTLLATAALEAAPFGDDNPSVWAHEVDQGRVFYSMVGHNAGDFTAAFAKPLLWAALRWAAHDE